MAAFSLEDIVTEVFDKLQRKIDDVDVHTKAGYDDSFIDLEEAPVTRDNNKPKKNPQGSKREQQQQPQ